MGTSKSNLNSCDKSFVNGTDDREAYPKRWIAVLVQVNCEKKTATRLGKVGYETYIPTQQEVHQWSDRKKKVDRLIMPMLVFVRATVREEEWLRDQSYIHKLLALPGSDEDKKRFATPIPDNQIERLKFLLENAGAALGMQELPALYLQYYYAINAFTTGKKEPLVVVYSGTIDLLEEDELQYIIGHELGHILSDHVLYHMMVQGLVDFINLPAKDLIELPLYYWSRMSELTADRAGLLACQDLNTAIRAMIKMAGLPQSQYDKINVQAFIDQARDFNEKNTGFLDETFKFIAIANSYHPWLVLRAAELLKWVESGEYDRIISEYRAVECTHCGEIIAAKSEICPICGGKHN